MIDKEIKITGVNLEGRDLREGAVEYFLLTESEILNALEENTYIFAKTMPQNPHFYTLRRNWKSDRLFREVVQYIRDNGFVEWFKGRPYMVLHHNGWKYWTMGYSIDKDEKPYTILINRAKIDTEKKLTANKPHSTSRDIPLKEYETVELEIDELTKEEALYIYQNYSHQVSIEYPSPKTNGKYQLKNGGYAGFLPVSKNLVLRLVPKVPIENLFRMIDYAYNTKLEFNEGQNDVNSLDDIFSVIANILAKKILLRIKRGLYREYVRFDERMKFLRGRLNVKEHITSQYTVAMPCSYQDFTDDIDDNRILRYTLHLITNIINLSDTAKVSVRHAYRCLNTIGFAEYKADDCRKRLYNRLNSDYQELHALCVFFLEHSGPSFFDGRNKIMPFCINMPALYEKFVASWLKANSGFVVKEQERIYFANDNSYSVKIDIVLCDAQTNKPLFVIDTKYKAPVKPENDDIFQISFYANRANCKTGILLYPKPLNTPFNDEKDGVSVSSLVFDIQHDIEAGGQAFLGELEWRFAGAVWGAGTEKDCENSWMPSV